MMGPGSYVQVHGAQSNDIAPLDAYAGSELTLPSRVLSAEQRQYFEVKSDENQALKEIREYGALWSYTEVFRDQSIAQLPDLLLSYAYSRLPIYSYGCSTGQEPYSLHVALRKCFGPDYDRRFPIRGYDRDANCVDMARSGRLLIDSGESSSEVLRLLSWAKDEIVCTEASREKMSVTIPDYQKVTFARGDVRNELFEFSAPVAIFLQNVLYHIRFDEQFAVMDRLCSLPSGSIVCLGSDTFTDRAAAVILRRSGAFSQMCELENVLMRQGALFGNATAPEEKSA